MQTSSLLGGSEVHAGGGFLRVGERSWAAGLTPASYRQKEMAAYLWKPSAIHVPFMPMVEPRKALEPTCEHHAELRQAQAALQEAQCHATNVCSGGRTSPESSCLMPKAVGSWMKQSRVPVPTGSVVWTRSRVARRPTAQGLLCAHCCPSVQVQEGRAEMAPR